MTRGSSDNDREGTVPVRTPEHSVGSPEGSGGPPAHPFDDHALQPLSALQHLRFCERRWALVHLEGVWAENRFTMEGKQLHATVHEASTENRPGLRLARSLRIRSLYYGLIGCADIVEFHRCDPPPGPGQAIRLEGSTAWWRPVPVEYKRGKRRRDQCYDIQLCAQVLCLEEMLEVAIPEGVLYQGKIRRRVVVPMDDQLRRETVTLIRRLHALVKAQATPLPTYDRRCESCSLFDQCLPRGIGRAGRVDEWLKWQVQETGEDP
ncbi:MAG: CRISPR-associated protein Cas4 [Candidatus Riflebacteria bacterium]|nr:CRISPR-associated protein Cas4 [Candidatus Riflebacteria bacterium]